MTPTRTMALAAAALFSTVLTTGAEQAAQQGTQKTNERAQTGGMERGAGQAQNKAGAYMEMSQARGTIKSLDRDAGKVTVDLAAGGEVNLMLPSAALQRFKPGDQVTVASQLAIAEPGHGTTGTRSNTEDAGTKGGTGTTNMPSSQ